MTPHSETNPYFDPSQNQGSRSQGAALPRHRDQRHRDQRNQWRASRHPDQQNRPVGPTATTPWPEDQQNQPHDSLVSRPQGRGQGNWPLGTMETGPQQPRRELETGPQQPRPSPLFTSASATEPKQTPSSPAPRKNLDRSGRPLGIWASLPEEHHGPQLPKEALPQQKPQHSQPDTPQVPQPPPSTEAFQPHHHGQTQSRQHGGLRVPSPRRTKLITWFLAGFLTIFTIVIILGGLIVLIVYLLFRPHNPQFDLSGVTLNAAYLDMDVLLNADLTVLANFTNPNKKVKVDFSYVVLDLYYGSTLIASQYVEPFSAARTEYKLLDIHLVTSQVRLPVAEIERLKKEISTNAVVFKIKGVFRARSTLGSLLRYSYRLYGTCLVMVNGPPTGVIRAKKCKTKR